MSDKTIPCKNYLEENEMPKQWYNMRADMKNKPAPLLNPATLQPITLEELSEVFCTELVKQELDDTTAYIDIPQEIQDFYKMYRPAPLVRAYCLEEKLQTPAKIYYKFEGNNTSGSHKLNSAIAQAYYAKDQGLKGVTTETGAGQWGTAMSIACTHFGLDLNVFMVRNSYNLKPYRKMMMRTYGGNVHASPSMLTEFGRNALAKDPDCQGSLGMAISEAVEMAFKTPNCRYTLGSVLNHVLLHQTIIGLEAEKQLEMAGDYPDKVIACFGGGSNFAGITFPFLRHKLEALNGRAVSCGAPSSAVNTRFMAAEPASCPKLTKGVMEYDFGDTAGMTPLIPMYTLGHDFQPDQIHAAGLRYHGGGQIVSQLKQDGFIESYPVDQHEALSAGILFSKAEGIIPAPESTHAIALAIREALKAKEEGKEEVILFNLSGHGLIELQTYDMFLDGLL